MSLVNLVRVATATTGTGTMTLGSADAGFLTMSQAGAVDGATYSYGIIDGANSEVGRGVWTSASNTLTRSVLKSTNSNTAISLTGGAKVFITALAEDILTPAMVGIPTAPTATADTNSTQIATTAFVHASEEAVVVSGLTGGTVNLTAAQCSVEVIVLTGTLTSNLTINFGSGTAANFNRTYTIYNLTTGSFTCTLQACATSPSGSLTVAQNTSCGVVTYTNIINQFSDVANADLFSSTAKGVVPASGGGTTGFLRADGTWSSIITATSVSVGGGIISTGGTSGIGYGTGAGGAITQATSRTTGVTLNKTTGSITLVSSTATAGATTSFTVTNSAVAATDTIVLSQKSGSGIYILAVTAVAAGSFKISVYTPAAVSPAEAPVINFCVIKGVVA